MSVRFYTSRSFPTELQHLGGYGDTGQDVVGVLHELTTGAANLSPWNFLTGIFVDKPKAEAAAQIAMSQTQAQAIAAQQQQRQETLRTVMMVGAGVVGLLALVIVMKPRSKPVAGYRRKRRARR